MKTNRPCWTRLLLLNAALVIFAAGCATNDRSYNQDFNQSLPTSPKYKVENVDDGHFQITLHQGSPGEGPQRVGNMKEAAAAVAESEAKNRGWLNWKLEYIQERDHGWMHILIADVTRKNPIEKTPDSTR